MRKLEVARRLVDFACNRHGLPQSDLLIDPLTFTIATGNEDDRKLAQWTLEGIAAIRAEFPDIQIILGLSNVSFGLNPAARAVLNSVFLDHAVRAGMTGAIVHVSKIRPLHLIAPEEVKVAEDLIFDRRAEGYDPLQRLLEIFADRKAADATVKKRADTVEGRLKDRIVDGDRKGLDRRSGRGAEDTAAARHHQQRAARRHEGGRRPVRRRQDAAAVRAAERRDDEGGGGVSRAVHGTRGGAGEGHHRARHGEGRRARHRQEPGRHHPDQQRLSGGQSRHQGAARRHAVRGEGASRARHRHVGPAGEIHRGDAREPGGNVAPGTGGSGAARRRGADPRLCRG